MAMEAWEMEMRNRGFEEAAEAAKRLREEYGDIPRDPQIDVVTRNIPINSGRLISGHIKHELTRYAWERGLEIKIAENKDLIESAMRVSVTGPRRVVESYYRDVRVFIQQNS